jgi:hypothetical protein
MTNPQQPETFEQRAARLGLKTASGETFDQKAQRLGLSEPPQTTVRSGSIDVGLPSKGPDLITGAITHFTNAIDNVLRPVDVGVENVAPPLALNRYREMSPYAKRYLAESRRLILESSPTTPLEIKPVSSLEQYAPVRGVKEFGRQIGHIATQNPLNTLTDLFITMPFGLSYRGGLSLTEEGRAYGGIITPEQEEESRRGLIALLAALPAGDLASSLSSRSVAAIGGSRLAQGIVGGQAAGLVGGATFGIMEAARPQERFEKAVAYGLLAVPIGLFFEATGRLAEPSKPDVSQPIVESILGKGAADLISRTSLDVGPSPVNDVSGRASELAQARQVITPANPDPNVKRAQDAFVENGDILKAIVRSRDALDPRSTVVVPRVTNPAEALNVALAETVRSRTAVHPNKDGTFDVAVGGDESWLSTATARQQFRDQGFVQRQLVSYTGKPYIYVSEGLLRDVNTGEYRRVPHDEIRRPTYNRLITPEGETVKLKLNVTRAGNLGEDAVKELIHNDFVNETNFRLTGEGEPTASFNETFDLYSKSRNLSPNEKEQYRSAIESQLSTEVRKLLSPEDRKALEKVEEGIRTMSPELQNVGSSNNLVAETMPNGEIVIRDGNHEATQAITNQHDGTGAERDFINKSGQYDGIHIDGGGDNVVPPSVVGGSAMPPSPPPLRPNEVPIEFPKEGWLSNFIALSENFTKYLTPVEPRYLSLDQLRGSEFWAKVIQPTQKAAVAKNSLVYPYLKRVQVEIDALAKKSGLTDLQLEQIFDYHETISPKQIENGELLKTRPLTNNERNAGQIIAADKIDLQKTFDFIREELRLTRKFKGKELDAAMDEVIRNMNMDEKHLNAAVLLKAFRGIDIASVYNVSRYARSLMANGGKGEYTRAEFAAATKMKPVQIEIARRIEKIMSDAEADGVVPNFKTIMRLVNYYPVVKGASIEDAFLWASQGPNKFGTKEVDFISKMMRSGEINPYERNPIRSLVRYLNAGMSEKSGFTNALKLAWDGAKIELRKIEDQGAREAIREDIKRYLTEVQGRPLPTDRLAQDVLDSYTKTLGIEMKVDARRNLVNALLSLTYGGVQAFRPMLGARDLMQAAATYYIQFGPKRATRMLELAGNKEGIQELRAQGKLLSQAPIQFSTPAEALSTSVGRKFAMGGEWLKRLTDMGFEVTLQRQVHESISGGAYLEVIENAVGRDVGVLTKLGRGEMSKVDAYKKLFLNSYDRAVRLQVDKLVTDGKMLEAAEMLAMKTARDVTVPYGMANHPTGWGTNTGRLFGQLGMWPTWMKSVIPRWFARGTAVERLGVMSRFAASQGAIAMASSLTGFNLFSWYMLPAMFFTGGPTVSAMLAVSNAFGGYSPYRRAKARRELLQMATLPIPGSRAIGDWAEAVDLANRGHNPVQTLGVAAGLPPLKGRFWLDDLFGTYPRDEK